MSDLEDKAQFLNSKTAQILGTPNEDGFRHDVDWLWDNDVAPAENVNHSPENINSILNGDQPLFSWKGTKEKKAMPKNDEADIPAAFKEETSEQTLVHGGPKGRSVGTAANLHLQFSKMMRDWHFKIGKYAPKPETDDQGFNLPREPGMGDAWRSRRPHPVRQMKLTRDADQAAAAAAWDDDKVSLWGHRFAGQLHHNFSQNMLDAAAFSSLPKEIQLASISLGRLREQKNLDKDWDGIAIGLGTDPLSIIGLTSFGLFSRPFQSGKQFAGSNAMNAMKKSLFGGAFLGAEGSVYGGAYEYAKQSREIDAGSRKEIDWSRITKAAMVTGGITATIGAGLPHMGKAVAAFNSIAASKARQKNTLTMGVGPTPGIGHNQGPDIGKITEGVDVPTSEQSGSPGWKSGAVEMVDGMQAKGDGQQLINYMYDDKRRGEFKVSKEELDVLGLREAFVGKKDVTPQDIKDHINENQPVLQESKDVDEAQVQGHEDDWIDHEMRFIEEAGGTPVDVAKSLRENSDRYLRNIRSGTDDASMEISTDYAYMEKHDGATGNIDTVEIEITNQLYKEDLYSIFNDIQNEVLDGTPIGSWKDTMYRVEDLLDRMDPKIVALREESRNARPVVQENDSLTMRSRTGAASRELTNKITAHRATMRFDGNRIRVQEPEDLLNKIDFENVGPEFREEAEKLAVELNDLVDDMGGDAELAIKIDELDDDLQNLRLIKGMQSTPTYFRDGTPISNAVIDKLAERDELIVDMLEQIDDYGDNVLKNFIEGRGRKTYHVRGINNNNFFQNEQDAIEFGRRELGDIYTPGHRNTQHSSVTMPGENPNYSEIRVRFPQNRGITGEILDSPRDLFAKAEQERNLGVGPFSAKKFPSDDAYGNVSQHFERDTIFHVRMSDREFVINDESTSGAFVHEIQSDYHQKAKNMYQTPENQKRYHELKKKIATADRETPYDIDGISPNIIDRYNPRGEHVDQYTNRPIVDLQMKFLRPEAGKPTVELTNMTPEQGLNFSLNNFISVFGQDPTIPVFKKIEGNGKGKIWKVQGGKDGYRILGATFYQDGKGNRPKPESEWLPVSEKEMARDSVGKEMSLTLEAANRVNDRKFFYEYQRSRADAPYKKSWVSMAVRRAAWEAMSNGHTFVAFPSTREAVSMVEYRDARSHVHEGIAKTYEKTIPKEIQSLVKQYGGELKLGDIKIETGSFENMAFKGSKIIGWDFSKVIDVIKSKGFRLPAVMGTAVGLNEAAQPKE